MARFIALPGMLLSCVTVAIPVTGQAQTAGQLQQLGANPDLVIQRIRQSGMSAEQIRARLQAAGYAPNLLDPYISQALSSGASTGLDVLPSPEALRALDLLVPQLPLATGVQTLPVLTGPEITQFGAAQSGGGGLRLFGVDVFRGLTTQFQPLLTGPVPPSYRVGPGDVMVLVITGDVEFVHELNVTREGFVVIPQVGQLYVNSLTMTELQRLLRDRLGRVYSGVRTGTTKFDVTIARLRTNQVFVIGEVLRPGAYQLASVATVLNALYAAGGPSDRGNFRQILVRRGTVVVDTLDLYDYLLRGDTKGDVVLEQGDVVFVPVRGVRASISGAIVRPAIYEMKGNQTLADLIEAAGGFQPEASLQRIAVHRVLPAAERGPGPVPRTVVDVQLPHASAPRPRDEGTARDPFADIVVPRVALEDGDSVVVDSVLARNRSLNVSIAGMVRKPGSYPWRAGMTLRDLVTLARGPIVGAYLVEAEVARLPTDRSQGQLATTLRAALDSSYLFERDSLGPYQGAAGVPFPAAGTAAEFPLEPYDHVLILKQPEFELQRTVTVSGEVKFPGNYALIAKDERLSSVIERAGGLLPTAYADGAQFYRSEGRAGRVNIDVPRALANPGEAQDVQLQPNDSLYVPEYNPTVRVEGAVNSPTSVLYREGEGLGYYIENAGGYARNADKGRVSVRYANGSAKVRGRFLFFRSSPTPLPGSVIGVPVAREREPFNVTQFLGSFAQILASTVAIVVIATRLNSSP